MMSSFSHVAWGGRTARLASGSRPSHVGRLPEAAAVSVLLAQRPCESPWQVWRVHARVTQALPRFTSPGSSSPASASAWSAQWGPVVSIFKVTGEVRLSQSSMRLDCAPWGRVDPHVSPLCG